MDHYFSDVPLYNGDLPDEFTAIAYTEYGKWYEIDNAIMSIIQARKLEYNGIITMVQKRVFTRDDKGKNIPTSIIQLLIRKKR